MHISVPEGKLYCEQHGRGRDTVIFLHGFTLDSSVWAPQIGEFRSSYRTIVYDAFGFGYSDVPKPSQPYCNVEHLLTVMNAFGVNRAHLVAMSMGGEVAIDFALMHPHRVASLTLSGAICSGQPWSEAWIERMMTIREIAIEQGVDAAKKAWCKASIFASIVSQPASAEALASMVHRYSGWHWLHRDPVKRVEPAAASRLEQLKCPILAITGANDITDFHYTADAIMAAVPQAQRENLDAVGHLPSWEVPAQFNGLMRDFLKVAAFQHED